MQKSIAASCNTSGRNSTCVRLGSSTPKLFFRIVGRISGAIPRVGLLANFLLLIAVVLARADDISAGQSSSSSSSPVLDYFKNWFERASQTQAEQPHWVTPLATVTPRLEQELRYDQFWQALPGGHTLVNYGGGKGLELIPAEPIELIIGVPAWETENTSPRKDGWADETFLIKYRILSANEDNGNYILTAFMGLSIPTGSANYTSHHYVYTPTIAFGKGWGRFDFQSTLAVTVPDNGGERSGSGTPVLFNTAFQYHVDKFFWPELEANYTYWPNGKHEGLNQLFLTPGLILGRFPIYHRVGLSLGVGCQIAVTDSALMHRNIIFSARVPF
jgi:hypothetical protein